MNSFLEFLLSLAASIRSGQLPQLGYWTYPLLALLVAVEGPIATLLGAAAASAGLMRLGLVFVAAATGNLTADSLWYSLGRAGKLEWALRFGRRLGLRREVLEQVEQSMHEHALKILFVAKITVSFIIPSLIAAGLMKIPWRRWFPAVFCGEMIWTGSLVLVGFYATEAVKRLALGIEYLVAGLSLLFILFLLWMGRRVLRKLFMNPPGDEDLER
jgi:membrane protein DedA with SNARE-associated domain